MAQVLQSVGLVWDSSVTLNVCISAGTAFRGDVFQEPRGLRGAEAGVRQGWMGLVLPPLRPPGGSPLLAATSRTPAAL